MNRALPVNLKRLPCTALKRWQTEFIALGKSLGGGSGWVLLTYGPHDQRLVNAWAADHTMGMAGGCPILALDMYEHSYHIDFGANAAAYVNAYMRSIAWQNADKLFEQCQVA
jgi:Fe-Mn family superoxide dismutase